MRSDRFGDGERASGKGKRTGVAVLVVIAPVVLTVILLGMLADSLCRKDL